MAKIRYLKTEHVRLKRDHGTSVKELQSADAEKAYWLRRVEKMETEVKRLKRKALIDYYIILLKSTAKQRNIFIFRFV